jgi:uncharacterized integral membrane protein
MKLWFAIPLGLLAFAAGIVIGLAKEARRIERLQKERRRIERDYPVDSIGE